MINAWNRLEPRHYERTSSILLRIADALVCIGAGLLALVARFGMHGVPDAYQVALALTTLLVLVLFPFVRVYREFRTRSVALSSARVVFGWILVMVVLLVLMVLAGSGERFSRIWMAEWFGLGIAGFVGLRLCVFAVLRFLWRTGRNMKRVALVGSGLLAAELRRHIATEKWMGFEIVAHYRGVGIDSSLQSGNARVAKKLQKQLEAHNIDEIWIAATLDRGAVVREVCELAKPHVVTVRYAPDFQEMFLLNHGITEVAGLPMIDLTAGPLQGINGLLKRFEDFVLTSIILVLAAPLGVAIAIAIRLTSPGPVIFKQYRHGWDGGIIKVYKFRTMRVHDDSGRYIQASRNDKRVTYVGRFLRRTSLDELPQLFNVLQGRMSLVGPRPHPCQLNQLYEAQIEGFMLRHKMRPGITGWAQVNGLRGETETLDKMEARVEHDLFYIEHWSLWLDLKILVLTLVRGFVNPNAY